MRERAVKADADEGRGSVQAPRERDLALRRSGPPADPVRRALLDAANSGPRAQGLQALQMMADAFTARRARAAPQAAPARPVVQRYFSYYGQPLTADQIAQIAAWLKAKGYDAAHFQALAANATTNDGAISTYLNRQYAVTTAIRTILAEGALLAAAGGSARNPLSPYQSDDSLSVSDGEDVDVYRPTTGATVTGVLHSSRSARNQMHRSLHEMRAGATLTQPNPTLVRMGSAAYEFAPSLWRKDFGVTPMRPTEDDSALERDGNAETYAELARRLDAHAARLHLSMADMNGALRKLFGDKDLTAADLHAAMDHDCLVDLRLLVAILLDDCARSSNAPHAIKSQVLKNEASFWDRFGRVKPEYVGAWVKKKDGVGGVQKLKDYST